MDISHLEPKEFEIECEVRAIEGPVLARIDSLKEKLESETKDSSQVPKQAHSKARKQPLRETATCSKLIKELKDVIRELWTDTEKDMKEDLRKVSSKLEHVKGRLERISSSPTAKDTANLLVKNCVELKEMIGSFKVDEVNQSLQKLNDMKIMEIDDVEVREDEGGNQRAENTSTPVRTGNGPQSDGREDQRETSLGTSAIVERLEKSLIDAVKAISSQLESNQRTVNNRASNVPQFNPQIPPPTMIPPIHAQPADMYHNQAPPPFLPFPSQNSPQPTSTDQNQSTSKRFIKKIPIEKWNIRYSGAQSDVDVERFLYRVEHLARSNEVTDEQLASSLSVLLHGLAEDWYWVLMERRPGCAWEDIKSSMIGRFQDRRTDSEIRQAMERRKQSSKETFLDFYHAILQMGLSLKSSMTDEYLLELLKRNMRSGLQLDPANAYIRSASELVRRCVSTEDTWRRLGYVPEAYMGGHSHQVSELQRDFTDLNFGHQTKTEDFSYRANTCDNAQVDELRIGQFPQNRSYGNVPQYRMTKNPAFEGRGSRIYCWNCDQADHVYKDCAVPPKEIFCYACGLKGVLKPKCTRCAGNNKRETNFFRGTSFPNQPSVPPTQQQLPSQSKPIMTEEVASNTDKELARRQQDP